MEGIVAELPFLFVIDHVFFVGDFVGVSKG
jgi:hypothetical protein